MTNIEKALKKIEEYSVKSDHIIRNFCHDKPNEFFVSCGNHAVCKDGECVTFDGEIIYDFCYDVPNEPITSCGMHGVCYNNECVDIGDLFLNI
jgi:hypothetical protein